MREARDFFQETTGPAPAAETKAEFRPSIHKDLTAFAVREKQACPPEEWREWNRAIEALDKKSLNIKAVEPIFERLAVAERPRKSLYDLREAMFRMSNIIESDRMERVGDVVMQLQLLRDQAVLAWQNRVADTGRDAVETVNELREGWNEDIEDLTIGNFEPALKRAERNVLYAQDQVDAVKEQDRIPSQTLTESLRRARQLRNALLRMMFAPELMK